MHLYKSILLSIVLIFLVTPVFQFTTGYFLDEPLSGDVRLQSDTSLNSEAWFNSRYQDQKEKFFNDNFGFRNFFVRVRNQIYYSLFNKLTAKDVVAGKHGFLYELKYLETHAGLDYIGSKKIEDISRKLKFIQDTLDKRGIKLVVLFAPGKASFYPEHIPFPYDVEAKETNYHKFIENVKKDGVNHIDFNGWFMKIKPTVKYPLYPQTGTHWSQYGVHLAFDSVSKYLESTFKRKLPRFDFNHFDSEDYLPDRDEDIAAGLNLLFPPSHYKMVFPNVKWEQNKNDFKPRVLTVSDSYWMGIYFANLPAKSFSDHEFWYYNKMLYNYDKDGKTLNPADFDLKQSVEKNDVIFIMATEASLRHIGWGFIDEVYNMYKNGPAAYEKFKLVRKKLAEIEQIKEVAWDDKNWLGQIKKQADTLHISVDSCLNMNVDYYYNELHKNDPITPKTREQLINEKVIVIKAQISENKEWQDKIKVQAQGLHISYDSCVQINALWLADNILLEERVSQIKKQISESPGWLNDIKEKAKKRNISLEACIEEDAKWMADEERKKTNKP